MRTKPKISYAPFWKTLHNQGISTYELTIKRGFNKGTLFRIEHGKNINLSTVAELCSILNCSIEEIVEIKLEDK